MDSKGSAFGVGSGGRAPWRGAGRSPALLPRLIASGCGVGWVPWAPGTVGSLVAALLGLALGGSLWLAAVLACAAGVWAIGRLGEAGSDPGWVVIDEFAGMWVAMLGLGRIGWIGAGVAFLLFRLFDIWKPGPVGWADRREGAVWVMADDLIAGVLVAVILLIVRRVVPGWLA